MDRNKERKNAINIDSYASKLKTNRILISRTDLLRDKKIERRNDAHTYKQSEVRDKLKSFTTWKSQDELVKISESLYVQSPQYTRLINYWSNLPTYDYVVVPKEFIDEDDVDAIKNDYKSIAKFMSIMSFKVNIAKVIRRALISDVFFGYVYVDDSAIQIQQFPNELCKISSIEDNAYNYAINLELLNKVKDSIPFYPMEIQKAYEKYIILKQKGSDKAMQWYEIPTDKSICIKVNYGIQETVPPFAGVFDSVYDINAFKDLRNDKAELENYKLIIQKLPIREDSNENNDFIIDMNMMDYFHDRLSDIVPTNVGVATTPMKIETVSFDKNSIGSDGVTDATKDFWNSSGVSQNLFAGESNTAQGIMKSIDVDEQYMFDILHLIEVWLNRFVKANNVSKYFKIIIPDVTHFSRKEVIERYITQGQYGFPVKTYIASLLGLEPIMFSGLLFLENEVLNLQERMIPFSSTFNTSGNDIQKSAGRPTNEESGKIDSDETARSRDKSSTVIDE